MRIIPAYAGSTSPAPAPSSAQSDHPRIRGEHSQAAAIEATAPGSSPHTRGALPESYRWPRSGRIIPAYAGSTPTQAGVETTVRDHPRIRGEHWRGSPATWRHSGSSPHTRGAPAFVTAYGRRERIIPAYAGSTCEGRLGWGVPWDHPRIRGEHPAIARILRSASGSSPHTRGAPGFGAVVDPETGIIPAYAGSTRKYQQDKAWRSDHPRIRGEHRLGWDHG